MIRISYTGYQFNSPPEPLTEEHYDILRNLSESQFKMQLKQTKKEAGSARRKEGWREFKFLIIVLVGCIALGSFFDMFRKVSPIFETIASIFGLIFTLAFFGTGYSAMLSSSSSARFVSDLVKHLKNQRKIVLLSSSYQEYVTAYQEESKKRK